jgi:hypothetical protein
MMIAKYGGDEDNDNVVTCLLASAILESHFPISAVRAFTRQNRRERFHALTKCRLRSERDEEA